MLLIKHAQYTLSIFLFALQEWWNAMGSCTLSTVADFQRSMMSFWASPFYCYFIIISRNQYKRLVSLQYHQLLSTLSFSPIYWIDPHQYHIIFNLPWIFQSLERAVKYVLYRYSTFIKFHSGLWKVFVHGQIG